MSKLTLPQKVILSLLAIIALCLCAMAIALIPPVPRTTPAPKTRPTATKVTATVTPTPQGHRGGRAIYQCRQFVRDRLVSPSSAKFSYEEAYKVNGKSLNYHAVTGVVESQNRLGVWLQSSYRCDAHYLPDKPGVWVLDYLDIQE